MFKTISILIAVFSINCKTLRNHKTAITEEQADQPVAQKHYYPEFYLATSSLNGPEKIGYFALFTPTATSQSPQTDDEKTTRNSGDFFLVEYDKSSSNSSAFSDLSIEDSDRLGLSGGPGTLKTLLDKLGFFKRKKTTFPKDEAVEKTLYGYRDLKEVNRGKFSRELTGVTGGPRAPRGTKDQFKDLQNMTLQELQQTFPELNFPDNAIVREPMEVYRGTGYQGIKSVTDIFLNGLKAPAFYEEGSTVPLNIDPFVHTRTSYGSAFVSTSTSAKQAIAFMNNHDFMHPSYLWEIDTPDNKGLDTAVTGTIHPEEKEIAILGHVNGSNIRGVWKADVYNRDRNYDVSTLLDIRFTVDDKFYRWIPNPFYLVNKTSVEKALTDRTASSSDAAQLAVLTRRAEIEQIRKNPFKLEKALHLAGINRTEYNSMLNRERPLGFSLAQWKDFQAELQAVLNGSGKISDSSVRVKGTPTTLFPENLGKDIEDIFTRSESSPPTLDIQVASEFYKSKLALKKTPISPEAEEIFSPPDAEKALPNIEEFCIKWRKILKMEINMTFLTKPKAAISGPNDFIVPI